MHEALVNSGEPVNAGDIKTTRIGQVTNFLMFSKSHKITRFFMSNAFISNSRLKLVKNHTKAKQHPEAELLLFENYLPSSSMLYTNSNRAYSRKYAK